VHLEPLFPSLIPEDFITNDSFFSQMFSHTSFSLPQKCKPNCLKFRQPCSVVGKWRVDSLKFYFEILSSMSSIVNFTNSSRRQAPLMPKMSTTCIESLLLALFMYMICMCIFITFFNTFFSSAASIY
jgi:hypothetical protein